MKLVTDVLECDVLIVGGGMAGAYAAIEASKEGSDVLLLTKGLLGKSGCSPMAAFLSIPPYFTPPDNEQSFFEDAVRGGASGIAGGSYIFLADQAIMKDKFDRGLELLKNLEEMGVYLRRDENGRFVLLGSGFDKSGGQIKPRFSLSWNFGSTGKSIMDVLRAEILRRGIRFREETRVTRVLTSDGLTAGVTALDYRNGDFFVVKTPAVILATGSGVYLWRYTTASRECTGDGHMMAYRAGAELVDLEIVTWHFADVAWPESMRRLQMYPQPFPGGFYPHWFDASGRRFLKDVEIGSKEAQAYALAKEAAAGNVGVRGRYFASWRHVRKKDLKEWYHGYRALEKMGVDTGRDLIECGMAAHSWHGGVKINIRTETAIPGLYAAGGIAPNHYPRLHTALWGGKVSGHFASLYAQDRVKRNCRNIIMPQKEIEEEQNRVLSLQRTEPADGYLPAQVKRMIRDLLFEKAGYLKEERTLRAALENLNQIRRDCLPRMRLLQKPTSFCMELVDAIDVIDMLDLAELYLNSCLVRLESRGPFVRVDYPNRDDRDFLKNTMIRRGNDGKPILSFVPVSPTFIKS